jgi:Domain of unknown function (DUF1929)/FlgD Ig-like domain
MKAHPPAARVVQLVSLAALLLAASPRFDARHGSAWAGLGLWDPVPGYPSDLDPVHLVHLPDGRFLFWGNPWVPTDSVTPCRLTDTTLVFSAPFYATSDAFCAGHTLLADSTVFVAGGNQYIGCCSQGIDHLNTFDPASDTWTRGVSMRWRRWYPTTTALADGRALITSGQFCAPCTRVIAETSEVYLPEKSQVSVLAKATLPWNGFLYPFMFLLPDGRLASVGPERATGVLDPITWSWTFLPIERHRFSGSAAMYLPGKILKTGGTTSAACYDNPPVRPPPPTRSAVTIDFTSPSPAWTLTDSMAFARLYHNLTILPDGKVLATGGCRDSCWQDAALPNPACSGTVTWSKEAELYDPEAPAGQRWTTLAAMTNPAVYHTTAALLPDGRVLVATGNLPHRAEVFTPPYLEGSPSRPAVLDAPGVTHYGDTLVVSFASSSTIAKVSLVRLASVTHGFDMNQRYVPCPIVTQDASTITAVAPVDANVAPPGFYMLFLVDANGVPSIAKYLLVDSGLSKVFPEDATFVAGDSLRGNLGSLFQSDNDSLVVGLNFGSPAELLLTGFAPAPDLGLSSLTFCLETRHSLPAGTVQTVTMRDFTGAKWDTLDVRVITMKEAVIEVTATDDVYRYISPQNGNEMLVRVSWAGAATNSTVRIDEAIWKIPEPSPASDVGEGSGGSATWAANGAFRLLAAAPNPSASGSVRIPYELTRDADVRLRIVDVTGRVVATVVDGRVGWGRHEVRWDRRGSDGRAVAAGTYFARMDVRDASQSRKITIVR